MACGGLSVRSQTLKNRGVPVARSKREAEKTPAPASRGRRPAPVRHLPLARQSSSTAPLSGLESDFRRSLRHDGPLARSRSLRPHLSQTAGHGAARPDFDPVRSGNRALRAALVGDHAPSRPSPPHSSASVSKLLGSIEAATAKRANLLLQRSGQAFWQDESYDRPARDGDEFRRAARPERYAWSSAGRAACEAARRPRACPTNVETPGGRSYSAPVLSSCSACLRASRVRRSPESMRPISRVRASPSSSSMTATVRPSDSFFSTEK